MATIYGNAASKFWKTYVTYTVTNNLKTYVIKATLGVHFTDTHTHTMTYNRPSYLLCNGVQQNFTPTGDVRKSDGEKYAIGTHTFTINKGSASKTVTLKGSIKHSSGDVTGTSTASVSFTVSPIGYTISYNVNGGFGTPTSQTQTHGTAISITGTKPARPGHDFLGWGTTSTQTTPDYVAGNSYMPNADKTLYAVWHLSYIPPKVQNLRAYRVIDGTSGYNPPQNSSGEKCYLDFAYVDAVAGTTTSVSALFGEEQSTVLSDDIGNKYAFSSDSHLSPLNKEQVLVTVNITDYLGKEYSYTYETFVSTENYIYDAFQGSNENGEYQAFAIGGIARDFSNAERSENGDFDCYMDAHFHGNVEIHKVGSVVILGSECYKQGTGTATTISTGSSYATLKDPSQFGYPGTWQLVLKTMTPRVLTSGFMTANSSNVSAIGTQHCYISGKTITIYASFTRSTAHTDASTTALATIKPSELGLSSICGSTFIIHGIDDGANGISIMSLTTAGALGEIDFISRSTSIPSTTGVTTFTFTFAVTDNYIHDSACSEFHWKRIS